MVAVPPDRFFASAAAVGVGLDPDYPDSGSLRPLGPGRRGRYWVRPDDAAELVHFVAAALDCLGDWREGVLWPRSGRWPPAATSGVASEDFVRVVLRGAGVPLGAACAVRVRADQRP